MIGSGGVLYRQLSDYPMTCPECDARTDWIEAMDPDTGEQAEQHTCLNKSCEKVFWACWDEDEDECDEDEGGD